MKVILYPRHWRIKVSYGCVIFSFEAHQYNGGLLRDWRLLVRYWKYAK